MKSCYAFLAYLIVGALISLFCAYQILTTHVPNISSKQSWHRTFEDLGQQINRR